MKWISCSIAAIIAVVAAPSIALAANGDRGAYLSDRLRLSVSAYWPELETSLQVNPDTGGEGTNLDVEADLALGDDETVARADLTLRLTRRQRLDLSYFDLDRSASTAIDREIVFGDETYPINASVSAGLRLRIAQLSYGWSFLNDGPIELGASVGAYVADLEARIAGQIAGGGRAEESEDTVLGLPLLGVHAAYALTPRLVVTGRGYWLSFDVDDYDVTLLQTNIGLDWQVFEHLGLNLGYSYYRFDVEVEKGDFSGAIDLEFNGPSAGVSVYF